MKKWLNKIVVTIVAVMTLGLYIPPTPLNPDVSAESGKDSTTSKENVQKDIFDQTSFISVTDLPQDDTEENTFNTDDYITQLTNKAKVQTMTKLGPKITNRVGDEFTTAILPHMEKVIEDIMQNQDPNNVPYYEITEDPASGTGERIFNIRNHHTDAYVAKFHVRRENRPLDGYWFNFHYHLSNDNFEAHHNLGDIFWDKNTPPKWMV